MPQLSEIRGGVEMSLGTRKVGIGGYFVWGEPRSWWHRITTLYWQSSTPKYNVYIQIPPNTRIPYKKKFFIRLHFSNDNYTDPEPIEVPPSQFGEKHKYKIEGLPLLVTGDTFLEIHDDTSEKTIYSFHTTYRSWLSLAIIAGFVAGLISLVTQIIIKFCFDVAPK